MADAYKPAPPAPPPGDSPLRATASFPRYTADELMGGHVEIRITHDGATYRLRKTASGKLILTK